MRMRKNARATAHPEYGLWAGMKARCHGAGANMAYVRKGIVVCERWRNSFYDFITDMGPRPSSNHSIDRINPDGNYEPKNCRWATVAEQARNKSNSISNEVGESEQINIKLAPSTFLKLDQFAKRNGLSVTSAARLCILFALPVLDDESERMIKHVRQRLRRAADEASADADQVELFKD